LEYYNGANGRYGKSDATSEAQSFFESIFKTGFVEHPIVGIFNDTFNTVGVMSNFCPGLTEGIGQFLQWFATKENPFLSNPVPILKRKTIKRTIIHNPFVWIIKSKSPKQLMKPIDPQNWAGLKTRIPVFVSREEYTNRGICKIKYPNEDHGKNGNGNGYLKIGILLNPFSLQMSQNDENPVEVVYLPKSLHGNASINNLLFRIVVGKK